MRKTLHYATVGVMVTLGLAGVGPTSSAMRRHSLLACVLFTVILTGRAAAQTPVILTLWSFTSASGGS